MLLFPPFSMWLYAVLASYVLGFRASSGGSETVPAAVQLAPVAVVSPLLPQISKQIS